MNRELLKQIPKVDRILAWEQITGLAATYPRTELLTAIRATLDALRDEVRRTGTVDLSPDTVCALISGELARRSRPSLRRVINGTGVVIHTNLGRSPLAQEAEEALRTVACGYSNLEFDLSAGERGSRHDHIEKLLCELTGAEAALVVNNNASAVLLALMSLARGREVVVSRGELVEIGGSFRIPEVMQQSGAQLVEVGATNRTHVRDYRNACGDATALFLKVHTSNFAVIGFTADVSVEELAAVGRENGVPVMVDAGSGCLIDLTPHGISGETTVDRYLAAGADLITFSGDKLLGGPQAGIIVGRRELVEPMKKLPLQRALRIDKLSLAALEATLRLYRDERRALRDIPTLRMLTTPAAELTQRADRMVRALRRQLPDSVTIGKTSGESSPGGGTLPLMRLPTTLLEIRMAGKTAQQIETELRHTSTPVIGRIHRGSFLLDVRTISDHELPDLIRALTETSGCSGNTRDTL